MGCDGVRRGFRACDVNSAPPKSCHWCRFLCLSLTVRRLARRRASNVQAALLELDPDLQSQISVGELQEVNRDEDEGVRMQIVLSAASDDGE